MAIVCPTVTAENPHQYREQIERLVPFAGRIHVDFMDGLFTKNQSISLEQAWLPEDKDIQCDIHLMYMRPDLYLKDAIHLKPALVIVQAEAKGDFFGLAETLHSVDVKVGVALLPETPVSEIAPAIADIDHVLIFSGHLGHFGGKANLALLKKATELKKLKPELEIAWDGGINQHNAGHLAAGGIDVLNVGGFIQRSENPEDAYQKLAVICEKLGRR